MVAKLLLGLHPLGPLSPLNPHSVMSPLRTIVSERRPPRVTLDDSHESLLAKHYGKGELQNIPFPNMEWWWNAIEVSGHPMHKGEDMRFSILSNVHVFAVPFAPPVVQGTVAVRDLLRKLSWQATTAGTLDPGPACRFTAHGWHNHWDRHDEQYHIDVIDDDIELKLDIDYGDVTYFNDPLDDPALRGWYDNNPDGTIPYWASYRSRFGRGVSGRLKLPHLDGEWTIWEGRVASRARFDHQSLHWSSKDVGCLSHELLAEALITRPQWLWYHAALTVREQHAKTARQGLNLMACELRNGHTGSVLKRAAALCDADGAVAAISPDTLNFTPSRRRIAGRVSAPKTMQIEFDAPGPAKWDLKFVCRDDQGWTVSYPMAGPMRYDAQEVQGDVKGEFRLGGKKYLVEGSGTLEVLDMLKSINAG